MFNYIGAVKDFFCAEFERHGAAHVLIYYVFVFMACSLLAANTLYAFFYLFPGWDYAWYHLPHALSLVDLLAFEYEYGSPYLYKVISHPPLAHFLQGILVWGTGLVQAANWINVLGFCGLLLFLKWAYRHEISLSAFILYSVSIPMIIMHYPSGFIDLWVAVLGCIAVVALERLIVSPARKWVYVSLLAILALIFSKMTVWVIAAVLGLSTAAVMWGQCRKGNLKWSDLFIYCGVGAALAPVWPLYLQLTYGNAFFPYPSPLDPEAPYPKILPQYEQQDQDSGFWQSHVIAERFVEWPAFARYLVSFSEVTRFMEKTPMIWSPDAFQIGSLHHRMGGYNFIVMIIGIFVGTCGALRYRNLRALAYIFCGLFAVTAFTMQSYELRYFMAVPLVLSVMVARVLSVQTDRYYTIFRTICLPLGLLSTFALSGFTYMFINNAQPVLAPLRTGYMLLGIELVLAALLFALLVRKDAMQLYLRFAILSLVFLPLWIGAIRVAQFSKTYFDIAHMYSFIPPYMKQFWQDAENYIAQNGMPERPFCHYPYDDSPVPEASHYHFRAFWSGPDMQSYSVTESCESEVLRLKPLSAD